jgi:peptidoglycan biosynthesis protein MviN/MurJ (putative lipid II flippase)
MATTKGTALICPLERTSRSGTRARPRPAVRVTFVRKFSVFAVLSSVLLLSGCSYDTAVTSNVGLTFPDQALPYVLAVVYGPMLLAVLAIVTSVVAIVTLLTTVRAARQGRTPRRWPVVVSVVLLAVLIVAAVAVIVLRFALSWVAFG